MTYSKALITALCALLAAVVLYKFSCPDRKDLSDEEMIRQILDKAQVYAGDRDREGLLSLVADDYSDDQGMKKNDLSRLIAFWFLRSKSIGVHFMHTSIKVTGNNARVDTQAVLTRGTGALGSVIPTDASVYDLQIQLERRDKQWKVVSHRRARVR
ncbi:MAG: hypothetical protein GXP49_00580 [Deltaproteobacteria bacterium]|nr:hypothetical protein [Deltaproteobacteria bacterium]